MDGDHDVPAYEAHAFHQQQPMPQAHPAAPPIFALTDNQLMQLLAAAQHAAPAPAPAPAPGTPTPAPTSRAIRPREPDPFGGDREHYKTWKSQMMRYLASSPDMPEGQRITILLSNVRGPKVDQWINGYAARHFDAAGGWAQPRVASGGRAFGGRNASHVHTVTSRCDTSTAEPLRHLSQK